MNSDLRLEIAHVLFIDIVGSSKLLTNEQSELLRILNQVVRETDQVRAAEAAGKLIRLPTGDGMALAFFTTPDAPVRCAMEISRALKQYPNLPVRMGAHSGPVDEVVDINERSNVAGAGITMAQRVMDCGDAGHILLSKRIADDLAQYSQWQPSLHDLGEVAVKHGAMLGIVNLYTDEVGNPAVPAKLAGAPVGRVVTDERRPSPAKMIRGTGIFLAALLMLAVFWFLVRPRLQSPNAPASAAVAEKRIAVLPFKPLAVEGRDQILELGMADILIAKLSASREIIVPSLSSVRKYTSLEQDSAAAGRELQVNSVLEGSVQKSGDRIHVTARLIRVADGASLWAGTFDEKFTDVFTVQNTISQKVADALALRLSGEEKARLARRDTKDVEAYQLYLTGRYHWTKLTPPEIKTSIGFFEQAIEKDPGYAMAYFGLAEANRSLAISADVPSKNCLPQAKAAAMRALDLDDSLPEAHASLSFSLIWFDWDWPAAEVQARRAIALNANSVMAHFAYAHLLSDMGRHDQALAEMSRARELDPVFLPACALEGMFLHHAGRDLEAKAKLEKALELDPNFWITHLMLGRVATQLKQYPEALSEFTKARELSHGHSEAIGSTGYALAQEGKTAEARGVLNELMALSAEHYIPPYNIALVHAGLGEQEEALQWLEKACDQRDVRVTLLKVDPRWNAIRSAPGFDVLLKRVGLK